jgi:hypothetical protein
MPEVSTKKLDRLKSAAKRGFSAAGSGIKSTVLPLVGGAGAEIVAYNFASKVPYLKDQWWGEGASLAIAGHYIGTKKNRRAGDAILGAAGYAFMKAKRAKDGLSKEAKGFEGESDAGALVDRVNNAVNQMNQAMAPMAQLAEQVRGLMDAGAIMGAGSGMTGAGDPDYVPADAGDWGDSF